MQTSINIYSINVQAALMETVMTQAIETENKSTFEHLHRVISFLKIKIIHRLARLT